MRSGDDRGAAECAVRTYSLSDIMADSRTHGLLLASELREDSTRCTCTGRAQTAQLAS